MRLTAPVIPLQPPIEPPTKSALTRVGVGFGGGGVVPRSGSSTDSEIAIRTALLAMDLEQKNLKVSSDSHARGVHAASETVARAAHEESPTTTATMDPASGVADANQMTLVQQQQPACRDSDQPRLQGGAYGGSGPTTTRNDSFDFQQTEYFTDENSFTMTPPCSSAQATPPGLFSKGAPTLTPPGAVDSNHFESKGPPPIYALVDRAGEGMQGATSSIVIGQADIPVVPGGTGLSSTSHLSGGTGTVATTHGTTSLALEASVNASQADAAAVALVPSNFLAGGGARTPPTSLHYTSPGRPVLYSAIGSLEDPGSSSWKGWKNQVTKSSNVKVTTTTQFAGALLPPANQTSNCVILPGLVSTSTAIHGTPTVSKEGTKKNDQGIAGGNDTSRALGSEGDRKPAAKTNPRSESERPASHVRGIMRSTDDPQNSESQQAQAQKKVTISEHKPRRKGKKKKGPAEMFRPSSDAYTPRMGKREIKYKPAQERTPVQKMATPLGTLSRPNFRDALRRVAMILHQHIVKIERRFESNLGDGLFARSMRDEFAESAFATPTYRCTMVRVPMARPGMVFGLKRIREHYSIPSESEIYDFAHQLFKAVQLSSECSIVCLIYVERLMEVAKVPLLANTWRPIVMCGLLLASKVWQDLSSWNVEFASVYPQFSLESINRLELQFLRCVKWDLYISSSSYAKYYFALRSLVEKPDFRRRYNRMVGGVDSVQAVTALNVEKRSTIVKEEALLQISRSM